MIDRKIPRDISKYETKLMLGFTTRQIVIGAPGIALAVAVYFLLKNEIGDSALFLALLSAAPFLAFAAYKPLGMPLEQFLKTAMLPLLLAPANRRYQTENTYREVLKPEPPLPVNKKNQKFVSQNPTHRAI
jgi:hypothetical protein